jgi:uncharacterized protein
MDKKIPRREFLKTTPAAAGMLAAAQAVVDQSSPDIRQPSRLGDAAYVPKPDYPRQPKRISEVTLRDSFWKPKIQINAEVTIPFEIRKFVEAGRSISNNVLEAAIYSLQTLPDAGLQAHVDSRIREIRASQQGKPATGNALFEVAAAYYVATGREDLLDLARKSADLIYSTFLSKNPPFSGGERDAINCIQLYRATQEKKYLDLAKHYLDIRGAENSVDRSRHNQSYRPVLQQSEAVGHAVNAASLMVSLTDVGVLTGIMEYFDAAHRIWLDVIGTKLYITGGIGSTGNEGFGRPYALPNLSAYCESCAAFMFATFNHKLFLATGDSRYIDVMERTMYNNAVDGVSASGDRFFYVNRLASAGDGRDHRWEKASLECCPPNLVRFVASVPGFIFAQGKDEIYVNLYVSGETSFDIKGRKLTLSVDSEMPWGGRSKLTVSAGEGIQANIKLRIPGWSRNQPVPGDLYSYLDRQAEETLISINGGNVEHTVDQYGYVSLNRAWKNGDIVEITFPFGIRKVITNLKVKDDRSRMAVERGPIVYCAEWPDCEGGRVLELLFDPKDDMTAAFEKEFCGGVNVLHAKAKNLANPLSATMPVKLIPYYLWANRGAGEMSVWLRVAEYAIGDVGPAGGLIFHVNPNFAADGWRYLEAAPFDQSAGAPWGCFRTLIPGARGTAMGAGRQNTKDILAACAAPGSAAALCANFSLNGMRGWFLPSTDELKQMYVNLKLAGLGDFGDSSVVDNYSYWSSTQRTADMADHLDFADNGRRQHYDDKDYPRRVRAIRAL